MTYVALMLILALAGTAEDMPPQPEGVITETCNNENADTNECATVTSTTTPSELPGPPPNG